MKDILDCLHRVRVAASTLYEAPYNGFNDEELVKELEGDVWAMGIRDLEDGRMGAQLKSSVASAEVLLGRNLREAG